MLKVSSRLKFEDWRPSVTGLCQNQPQNSPKRPKTAPRRPGKVTFHMVVQKRPRAAGTPTWLKVPTYRKLTCPPGCGACVRSCNRLADLVLGITSGGGLISQRILADSWCFSRVFEVLGGSSADGAGNTPRVSEFCLVKLLGHIPRVDCTWVRRTQRENNLGFLVKNTKKPAAARPEAAPRPVLWCFELALFFREFANIPGLLA